MPLDFFYCFRCQTVCGNKGYVRHMAEAHEGRSDCVLGLTKTQVTALLAGATIDDIQKGKVR